VIWVAERSKHQRRVVAALYEAAGAVPCGRKAVLAGGLRGSGKAGALASAGVDPGCYLLVSVDVVLREMTRRSLIPVVAGLSPLDGAALVHGEARFVAKRLAARAVAEGRNLLLDVTMGSQPSVMSWLVLLGLAAYTVQVVTAPMSVAEAMRWAEADHRAGYEAYLAGYGEGGRYVPPEAIAAAVPVAESIARSDWSVILADLHAQNQVKFPSGRLLALTVAYQDGQITLQDLCGELRGWPLAEAPAVCPPGLEAADPALDDPDPWEHGSFDELVLACDLGILTDRDYAALVSAITSG
jgi:hypothetical protein